MKKLFAFMGFLVLIAGLLPYLSTVAFLDFLLFLPIEGTGYHGIIIALGAITLYLGIKK